jgi:pimeloyl-[acyl-carrier protein] methyl ester esterase
MFPTVILLPGMDGTGELFAPFLAAAKGDFKTVVVKYPTTKPLAYAELTSLVESQLPTGEPFVLLAESFSGPIAVSVARRKPNGLTGLVLCAAFVRNPRPSLSYFIPLLGLISLRTIPLAFSVLSFLVGSRRKNYARI